MVELAVRRIENGTETNMVDFDFTKTPITQIADYIIIVASKMGASDIHFDPREDGMMIRIRVDGDLQDYTFIPKAYERNLITRLKLLANMNITESRLPQDGAIKGNYGDQYLDMRVSCLPLNEGEKIVIRILDYTRSLQGIDSLGFNQTNNKKLKRMMAVPNGIILVTGATGSGKSTTVYSVLQGLNKPEVNIVTVEDPIEMNIEGMNQVQVNSEIGMTFAAALRSILRQDPNVILIGEIRDSETAQIAVRASITGHLVLSTIHTNNSLSTIERLLDMDVERYLLSTALTGIISQRLAKRLCPKCRIQRETTKYEKKVFKRYMNRDVVTIWDANPKGCDQCRKGYRGRIAIQEVLEIDDEIRNAINNERLKKENLSKMVYTTKTITLLQDALGKALSGLTSFEEVYRVIEIETDGDDTGADLTKSIEEIKEPEMKAPTVVTAPSIPPVKEKNEPIKTDIETLSVSEAEYKIKQEEKQPEELKVPIVPIADIKKEETKKLETLAPTLPISPKTEELKASSTTNTKKEEIKKTEALTSTIEELKPTPIIVPNRPEEKKIEPLIPNTQKSTQPKFAFVDKPTVIETKLVEQPTMIKASTQSPAVRLNQPQIVPQANQNVPITIQTNNIAKK